MRLVAIALCSVISAQTAAAQPGACNVTIVRAPDGVREVVESSVRAEPRCTGTLEVRIVATDGGYYVFARDLTGHIRERVVPDPQSAGVLIASWAAGDVSPAAAPPLAPPSLVPATAMQEPAVDAVPPAPRREWRGSLTLGYATAGDTDGIRGEADVFTHGPFAAGVALTLLHYEVPVGMSESVAGRELRAVVYGSATLRRGPASIRIGLGVGAFYTDSYLWDGSIGAMQAGQTGWAPVGEVSAELGIAVNSHWSLMTGVIGTLIEQDWISGWSTGEPGQFTRYGDVMGILGVRWQR